jgi:hypothetical protein
MCSYNSPSCKVSLSSGRRLLGGFVAAFFGLAGALTASAQSVYSSPYTISTLAGAGFVFAGYQNGTGTAAQFNAPYGVAADTSGNVYVADSANFVIRMITSGGVVTTLAGDPGVSGNLNGTGTGAQFGSIRGIALDGQGNLYVTDYTYGTVRKVVISTGAVSTFVPASAGLSQPIGIVYDPTSSSIYVADAGNYVIRKVSSGGSVSVFAGSVGSSGGSNGTGTGAQFSYPTGVAVDGHGNVYVADSAGNTVRMITSGGVVTTFCGQFGNPGVVDGSVSGAVLNHPYGIATDSAGDIFMTDSADLVREISASGTVSTLAGEQGQAGALNGTGVNAWFNSPAGIASNGAGTVIYIADTDNNMIRMGVPYNTAQPPQIQYQPQGVSTSAGDNVVLQVTATGVGLSYRWQFNNSNLSDGGDISGSLTNTLDITGIALNQAGNYTVVVTNASGSVISNAAVVTVLASGPLPVITIQPASQTVNAGATPTLSVTATGATGYQWQFNGSNITNAVTATLTLADIGTTQMGSYTVVLSNSNGSVTSAQANVTVNVGSSLYNISSRAYLGSGTDQNIVAGFYTNGSGSKKVVLGGIGPDLTTIDPALSGLVLTNPKLTLFNGSGTVLATNTAWGGSQTLVNALASVFAPPLPTNSNDTLIFTSVPAGAGIGYTAEVDSANSGGTGIALIEAYDYDAYTGTPASNLINISTRAFVGTGNDVLVAGFWSIGSTSQTVLIRAVGPGLAASNSALTGLTLVTPTLTLYDSSGNIIATNTGWGNAPVKGNSTVAAGIQPATTAIMNSVFASAIASGSADCAMVVTLPPNSGYTAQVNGVNSTTGIALVEVYNVP